MYRNPFALTGTLLLAAAFAASPASAQSAQEPESSASQGLAQDMVETRFPGFLGGSRSGWSTRFDPQFNPAIGFILDTVWIGGGEGMVEGAGGLDLRTAELDIASRIDPLGWAYAVAAFEGDEFELEEAALFIDQGLPANLSLRAGRYLADFGKWNTIHLHDKSYVFEDGVRESVFGGNLNVEGIELHQWGGIGDVPFRWSFGVATGFGGHSHGEEDGEEHGSFGQYDEERSSEQWAYTGRFTVQHDVGQNGYFQWGASGFHTNNGLMAEADTDGDGAADVEAGVAQTTLAVDLTLRMVDASALTANTASMEVWYTDREALAEPSAAVEDREALGVWGFYQHDFDPNWGAGVMAGWWQEPGESTSAGIFERDEAGAMRAAYVDWRLSEFNRLRLQFTQFLPEEGGSAWAVALQWDVILGSHAHPLDF